MARRFLLAIFALLALQGGARADTYLPVPVTQYLSVTAGASIEYRFDKVTGGLVDWIAIKNDCTGDVSFGLRSTRDASSHRFPILLKSGESWSGSFQTFSVMASNLGAANCTFTVVPGIKQ